MSRLRRAIGPERPSGFLLQPFPGLVRHVPRGTYPVEVLGDGALARLVIAPGTPARWELAVRDGQDERALRPGQIYGERVGGVGCFADALTSDVWRTDRAALHEIVRWLHSGEAVVRWPASGDCAIVGFRADGRDRECASWWGLDDDGNVLELVTHFSGDYERPALPDDPAFRHAWAHAQVTALKTQLAALRAARVRLEAPEPAQAGTLSAFAELHRLEDDAAVVLPEILAELGADHEREASTWLWLTLARDLACYDACQVVLARWLPRAPRVVAHELVQTCDIRHMQDDFAHVFADVIATMYDNKPLEHSLLGLVELETGRDPFRPLLERLARRSDPVGDAARAVLAHWYGS